MYGVFTILDINNIYYVLSYTAPTISDCEAYIARNKCPAGHHFDIFKLQEGI